MIGVGYMVFGYDLGLDMNCDMGSDVICWFRCVFVSRLRGSMMDFGYWFINGV